MKQTKMDTDMTTKAVGVGMSFGFASDKMSGDDMARFLDHVIVVIGRGVAAERDNSAVCCDVGWHDYISGIEERLRNLDNEIEAHNAKREDASCSSIQVKQ